MKKIVLLFNVVIFLSVGLYAQGSGIYSDSNYLKLYCYLETSLDQLESGFINKFEQLKNTSSFADSTIIIPIESKGLPTELTFFRYVVHYSFFPKPFQYTFCYNQENGQFYKMKGFYENEFIPFFDFLKTKGYKITSSYFKKMDIIIEGINTECLIDLYKSKKNKLLSDLDKASHECLKYNMQPVTTY